MLERGRYFACEKVRGAFLRAHGPQGGAIGHRVRVATPIFEVTSGSNLTPDRHFRPVGSPVSTSARSPDGARVVSVIGRWGVVNDWIRSATPHRGFRVVLEHAGTHRTTLPSESPGARVPPLSRPQRRSSGPTISVVSPIWGTYFRVLRQS